MRFGGIKIKSISEIMMEQLDKEIMDMIMGVDEGVASTSSNVDFDIRSDNFREDVFKMLEEDTWKGYGSSEIPEGQVWVVDKKIFYNENDDRVRDGLRGMGIWIVC